MTNPTLRTEYGPIVNVIRIDDLYTVTCSATRRVHRLTCVRRRATIDADYAPVTEQDGELWGTVRASNPEFRQQTPLLTLGQVEQLPAYDACEECRPPTTYRAKTATVHTPLQLSDVATRHLGQVFTVNGSVLGPLRSYTVDVSGVTLSFDEGVWRATLHDQANISEMPATTTVPWT